MGVEVDTLKISAHLNFPNVSIAKMMCEEKISCIKVILTAQGKQELN